MLFFYKGNKITDTVNLKKSQFQQMYKIKKGRGERPNCINKPNYLQSYRKCLVLVIAKLRIFEILSIVLR